MNRSLKKRFNKYNKMFRLEIKKNKKKELEFKRIMNH